MAATVPIDGQKTPALVFRFANPDGSGFYNPMVLVCHADELRDLKPLITKAVDRALEAARGRN